MFRFNTRMATTILLTTVATASLTVLSARQMAQGQSAPPLDEKMFPDGVTHDFGKVKKGSEHKHTFRIVNTSNALLRIISVRSSAGRALSVRPSKDALQPNEVGTVEITLDSRNFVGPKNITMFIITDNGKKMETRFWVTAVSEADPNRK